MGQIWIIAAGLCSLLACAFNPLQAEYSLCPIFDGHQEERLPLNFRTTKDQFGSELESLDLQEGLYDIPASGSGQFSETSFQCLTRTISKPNLVVIDLRQESHGLVNGQALSWTDGKYNWANVNKTLEEIEHTEEHLLKQVLEKGIVVVNPHTQPQELPVYDVKTEREFIQSLGFAYKRIPVKDHCRPSDESVDEFVNFIKNLPSDTWVHFHCRAGKGRTTTFLALYDMMINANRVSFDAILARHKMLGGTDLLRIHEPDHYRHYPAIERLEFVRHFYQYCRQVPDFHISWSEWSRSYAQSD